MPLLSLQLLALNSTLDVINNVSGLYIWNSIVIAFSAAFIATFFGVVNSWFIVFYSFPGKRIIDVMNFMPLAVPVYISAIVYSRLFEFSGPLQTVLRNIIGRSDYWFPNIKSIPGIIMIFAFGLYPYVYMIVRASFLKMYLLVAAGIVMGRSKFAIFVNIVVPAVKIPIIFGFTLVIMEILSDFGAPHFLGIDTFSTGIYKTWFLLRNREGAALLSLFNVLIIACVSFVGVALSKKGYLTSFKATDSYNVFFGISKFSISFFLYLAALVPVIFGFIIPVLFIITMLLKGGFGSYSMLELIVNSVYICFLSGIMVSLIAIFVVYSLDKARYQYLFNRIFSIGYAVPGVVCTLSIMVLFEGISNFTEWVFGYDIVIIGTIFALIYGYVFRFLIIGISAAENGKKSVSREIEWSFRVLGYGSWDTYTNIHFSMSTVHVLSGFLLIFVDTIKELPITLILRPAGFETLATKAYSLISDELYIEAAFPLAVIVLVCILSTLFVYKCENSRP